MNPLASHWFRVAVLLFIASPAVALLVVLTTNADFATAGNQAAAPPPAATDTTATDTTATTGTQQ